LTVGHMIEEVDVSKEESCSFCRKPLSETGPIVEGAGTGSGRVFICRPCAELAIGILIDEDLRRRGEKPVMMAQLTREIIDICTKALEHFEALSKQRALTEVELERKRRLEADLERLRSEA
jgi:ClpX C4-type zinc finger